MWLGNLIFLAKETGRKAWTESQEKRRETKTEGGREKVARGTGIKHNIRG